MWWPFKRKSTTPTTISFGIVRHAGTSIFVEQEVMNALGLRAGQRVSAQVMWQVMDLNSAAMRAKIEAMEVSPKLRKQFNDVMDELEPVVAKHLPQ